MWSCACHRMSDCAGMCNTHIHTVDDSKNTHTTTQKIKNRIKKKRLYAHQRHHTGR